MKKFTEMNKTSKYSVLTEEGYKPIISCNKTIEYNVYEIILEDNISIKCADNHIFITEDYKEVYAIDSKGCKIRTKYGSKKVLRIESLKYKESMYDLSIDSENHTYYTNDILSHNTVMVASYILWKAIFGKNTTHGIAGQLTSTAVEVLDKIKSILYGLPFVFLPGVEVFNKRSVTFDNGVRILTSTANGDAFRGFSIIGEELDPNIQPSGAVLYMDETAYIKNNDIKDFEDAVLPTVESAGNSQIIKSSTAKGRNHWYFDVKKAKDNKITVKGNFKIEGVEIKEYYEKKIPCKEIKNIKKLDEDTYLVEKARGKSGYVIVEANYFDKYAGDLKAAEEFKNKVVADKGLMFFQQAYANQFTGSSDTLIDDKVLEAINFKSDDEILHNTLFEGLRIFDEPIPGHYYIVTCDPKKDGIDEVGIHVIDVTNIPFKQVAVAQLMESYLIIPGRLFDLGNYYNTAMVVCENNIAESIPTTLFYNYEYEGEIYTPNSKKKKTEMGVRTTTKTKRMGLTMLKNFVENENLIIQDQKTVEQLFNFVKKSNGTYSAIEGEHDDLVMSLMLSFFPFFNFKKWTNFKGFASLLEKRKKEKEIEEQEMMEFLDIGFADIDYEPDNISPFTEEIWEGRYL